MTVYQVRKYLTEDRVVTTTHARLWDIPGLNTPSIIDDDALWASVVDLSDGMLVQVYRRTDSGEFAQVDLTRLI